MDPNVRCDAALLSSSDMEASSAPGPSPRGAGRRAFAEVPEEARPYAVCMRDGVRLATDVYLPRKGIRWPVLLSRLPYDKAGPECFMPDIARWFTERGYAVVVQDVRGKIRSGGSFEPFANEVEDGYDTISWIVEQTWCTGAVGMFGDSYFGWTQWAAATARHPALQAIAPRVISADATDMISPQGVFALEVCALWALETCVDEALYDYEGQLDWGIRPLSQIVPTALGGGRRLEALDRLAAGLLPTQARLQVRGHVPALHLGGWWDILHRGQLATWRQARSSQRSPQYLVMDATDHGWTHLRESSTAYVDPRANQATMDAFLGRYLNPLLPFFNHFLTNQVGYRAPPVRWMLAHDTWHDSEEWPPRQSRTVDWFPVAGSTPQRGTLSATPNRRAQVVSWTHDPSNPVPSLAHAYHPLIEPADEMLLEAREDVLAYESQPVREPLDLAGPASFTLHLTSNATSAHLMATVSDIAPNGTALKILDGVTTAHLPWPRRITVDLGSTGYRLLPQHRLRLALSASQFPRYILHPGTAANPWTTRQFHSAEQQVLLGGPQAARLSCSVLPTLGVNS